MPKQKITMTVEETVTVRKEVTVEYDPDNTDGGRNTPEQLLRAAFSGELCRALAAFDLRHSEGLNYYEDPEDTETADPDDLADLYDDEPVEGWFRFYNAINEREELRREDDSVFSDQEEAVKAAMSFLTLSDTDTYAEVEWASDEEGVEVMARLYKHSDGKITVADAGDDAYTLGQKAHIIGLTQEQNPFRPGNPDREAWENGWINDAHRIK